MNEQTPLRLLLADDHPFVREGIRSFLTDVPDIDVIGEAASGDETIELARKLKPDLVLLDINMPGVNGLEAVRLLRKTVPETKILMLTVHNSREYVLHVAKSGAHGYILKESDPSELLDAIRCIRNGQRYYSPAVAAHVVADYQHSGKPAAALAASELHVLILTAKGKSMKEIADELGISIPTVQTYRSRLMEKLRIDNLAGLIKYALKQGYVD